MLLFERRGVKHRLHPPRLTARTVLGLAESYFKKHGAWPAVWSGKIDDAHGTWRAIDKALRYGRRGLPGGSSLSLLLLKERGVRNVHALSRLSGRLVLSWADAFRAKRGRWPNRESGPIPEAETPGETWATVNGAFIAGSRGLSGYGSLARFLMKKRKVRNRKAVPSFSTEQVIRWAKAFLRRTGRLPRHTSGPIPEAPGETWGAIHSALYQGHRGCKGGSSLYRVMAALSRKASDTPSRTRTNGGCNRRTQRP